MTDDRIRALIREELAADQNEEQMRDVVRRLFDTTNRARRRQQGLDADRAVIHASDDRPPAA